MNSFFHSAREAFFLEGSDVYISATLGYLKKPAE